ncbi:MAG: UDP-N-acetylglucosamine pyrophosphorylase [Defluviitaleaceae bacterium]|nr:UDP-N-acetylglucosamine pyrophosphorylase [Defluviitaleaceae bacterium]
MIALIIPNKTEFSERKILGKTVLEHLIIRLSEGFDEVLMLDGVFDRIKSAKDENVDVFVISGDIPLVEPGDLESLLDFHINNDNDFSYVENILSGGVCFFRSSSLFEIISICGLDTLDSIEVLISESIKRLKSGGFISGNTFTRTNNAARFHRIVEALKLHVNLTYEENGVQFIDIDRCNIDFGVEIGKGTVIYPGVIIEGETVIGENNVIGPGCHFKNMKIGNSNNMSNTVAYDSEVGDNTETGPFAYIRPGCKIGSGCKVGDFVEVKNSVMGDGAKASHLTYIGDADIGKGVNLGCGTVVVNYDGKNKFRTVVEDDCFVGCNTNLISPVTVKKGAFIAAGSTITEDVPECSLAIARARQVNKFDWERPVKK